MTCSLDCPAGGHATAPVTLLATGNRAVRIRIDGSIDDAAAAALRDVCDHLALYDMARLDLDISAITGSTSKGVAAVARCLALGRALPGGVGVSVASEEGRRVLLTTMTIG